MPRTLESKPLTQTDLVKIGAGHDAVVLQCHKTLACKSMIAVSVAYDIASNTIQFHCGVCGNIFVSVSVARDASGLITQ